MIALANDCGPQPTFEELLRDKNSELNSLLPKWAKSFSRWSCFFPLDKDDLLQEFSMRLWNQCQQFDRHRSSWKTFAKCIVGGVIGDLADEKKTQKRDYQRRRSLNMTDSDYHDDQAAWLGCDAHRHRGIMPRSEEELGQLTFDVNEKITGMPEDLQLQCLSIMADDSLDETATALNDTKYRVRGDRERIRRILKDSELDSYVSVRRKKSSQ